MADWKDNLLEDTAAVQDLLARVRRIAVLGIKTEAQRGQPAYDVPAYMAQQGYDVVPVPVYYPDVTHILEKPVFRRVADVPGAVDLVNVFRRPQDVPAHVADIRQKKPRAVWMQLGIRHDAAAEELARAGILVVQDRCLLVDHRMMRRRC